MKIISVINYKGGVGKTTVTANLGALLAYRGYRVLLIDLDPQASLTFCFFSPEEWKNNLAEKRTIKQWFEEFMTGHGDTELSQLILNLGEDRERFTRFGGRLDLIASHLRLINVDLDLAIQLGQASQSQSNGLYLAMHGLLAEGLLNSSFPNYDIVLVDCPPNLNIVTRNAIVASDHLLIPSRADYLSTLGIHFLIERVDELVKEYNDHVHLIPSGGQSVSEIHPNVLGVIFTMVQIYAGKPVNTNQDFIRITTQGLQEKFKVPAFNAVTRFNQRVYTDASSSGVPLAIASNVPSEVTQEIERLTDEFLKKLNLEGKLRGRRFRSRGRSVARDLRRNQQAKS